MLEVHFSGDHLGCDCWRYHSDDSDWSLYLHSLGSSRGRATPHPHPTETNVVLYVTEWQISLYLSPSPSPSPSPAPCPLFTAPCSLFIINDFSLFIAQSSRQHLIWLGTKEQNGWWLIWIGKRFIIPYYLELILSSYVFVKVYTIPVSVFIYCSSWLKPSSCLTPLRWLITHRKNSDFLTLPNEGCFQSK